MPHPRPSTRRLPSYCYARFVRLAERRRQRAGTLSGGEPQLLAIARALMARPRMLLMDEPSAGLAPIMVEEIVRVIDELHGEGLTILLVEQNVGVALRLASVAHIIRDGGVAVTGAARGPGGQSRRGEVVSRGGESSLGGVGMTPDEGLRRLIGCGAAGSDARGPLRVHVIDQLVLDAGVVRRGGLIDSGARKGELGRDRAGEHGGAGG